MNNDYNFYDSSMFNYEFDQNEKRKKQRSVFSRLFAALFAYLLSFQVLGVLVYVIAPHVLTEAQYAVFSESAIASVLVSSGVQYLLAFPLFLLLTRDMDVSEKKEKKKLSVSECIIFFAISEALMFIGNLVGTTLNSFIGTLMGEMPENGIAAIVEETPMWLIFILMVIVAPIVEELMFRKIMIDRLSVYGDHIAIGFSAVAFGLMHGNLYQMFYATLLGAFLGYVYTRTRDVKYTVILHMIINFFGSIVALPVQKALERLYELSDALMTGAEFNMTELIANGAIAMAYSTFQYGLVISGIFAAVHLWRKRDIRISTDKEIYIPDRDIIKGGIVNVGCILFTVLSLVFMVLNLF